MKSLYIKKFDLFVRYIDSPGILPIRLILPGLATTSLVMMDLALDPRLRSNRTILIDYPGVMMSETSNKYNHSLEEIVICIAEVLIHEDIKNVEIIGHSMGGTVAAELAMKYPNLVSKIVICEANIEPGGGPGSSSIASLTYDDFTATIPDYFNHQRSAAISGDPTGVFLYSTLHQSSLLAMYKHAVLLVNLRENFKHDLYNIDIPITFIYGEKNLPENQGRVWPDSPDPEELRQKGINTEVVPNSGHFMMIDNFEGYIDCILKGLSFEKLEAIN